MKNSQLCYLTTLTFVQSPICTTYRKFLLKSIMAVLNRVLLRKICLGSDTTNCCWNYFLVIFWELAPKVQNKVQNKVFLWRFMFYFVQTDNQRKQKRKRTFFCWKKMCNSFLKNFVCKTRGKHVLRGKCFLKNVSFLFIKWSLFVGSNWFFMFSFPWYVFVFCQEKPSRNFCSVH